MDSGAGDNHPLYFDIPRAASVGLIMCKGQVSDWLNSKPMRLRLLLQEGSFYTFGHHFIALVLFWLWDLQIGGEQAFPCGSDSIGTDRRVPDTAS